MRGVLRLSTIVICVAEVLAYPVPQNGQTSSQDDEDVPATYSFSPSIIIKPWEEEHHPPSTRPAPSKPGPATDQQVQSKPGGPSKPLLATNPQVQGKPGTPSKPVAASDPGVPSKNESPWNLFNYLKPDPLPPTTGDSLLPDLSRIPSSSLDSPGLSDQRGLFGDQSSLSLGGTSTQDQSGSYGTPSSLDGISGSGLSGTSSFGSSSGILSGLPLSPIPGVGLNTDSGSLPNPSPSLGNTPALPNSGASPQLGVPSTPEVPVGAGAPHAPGSNAGTLSRQLDAKAQPAPNTRTAQQASPQNNPNGQQSPPPPKRPPQKLALERPHALEPMPDPTPDPSPGDATTDTQPLGYPSPNVERCNTEIPGGNRIVGSLPCGTAGSESDVDLSAETPFDRFLLQHQDPVQDCDLAGTCFGICPFSVRISPSLAPSL